MTVGVKIAEDAGPWEDLWLRSLAMSLRLEPQNAAGPSHIVTNGSVSEVGTRDADILLWGEISWRGAWDVHESLVGTGHGHRRLLVMSTEDVTDRIEHLITEVRHASEVRGRPLTVVLLGSSQRRLRTADHLLEEPGGLALMRVVRMAAGVIVSRESSGTLGRLARRAGVSTLAIERGVEADHVLEVLSPIEAADFLAAPSPAPLSAEFAPDLVSSLRSIGAA